MGKVVTPLYKNFDSPETSGWYIWCRSKRFKFCLLFGCCCCSVLRLLLSIDKFILSSSLLNVGYICWYDCVVMRSQCVSMVCYVCPGRGLVTNWALDSRPAPATPEYTARLCWPDPRPRLWLTHLAPAWPRVAVEQHLPSVPVWAGPYFVFWSRPESQWPGDGGATRGLANTHMWRAPRNNCTIKTLW